MAGLLTLRLLGTLEIALDGVPFETDRRKAVALLVYLAVTGQAYSRDTLAALFWPDHEPAKAYAYLRRTLWELSHALGEGWLEADRETVGLHPGARVKADVLRFQELVSQRASPAETVARLTEAVALYGGDFLPGLTLRDSPGFDEWQSATTENLRRQLGEALQTLAEAQAARGDTEAALAQARRWLALDTLNEVAHRQVMELLALSGQRTAALRQYETCARTLRAELDVTPEAATTALYQRIKAESGTEPPGPPPPAETDAPDILRALQSARLAPKHNLPAQLTSFIGREKEIEHIKSLLAPAYRPADEPLEARARLVTLTGSGGTGKTRLALQVAGELVPAFPDGVWFVELAPITNPALVPQTVLTTLRLREEKDRPPAAVVADYVCDRTLLLLFDNCEHLIDASARLAEALLRAGPNVWIMATSRETLDIAGETTVGIPSLSLPEAQTTRRETLLQSEAGRLFVERAQSAWPGFELSAETVPAVTRVCRRLDGIPLALELAAARVKTLQVEQIAARLDDRFRLLTGGSRTALPRQQTLRALIDWSYNLLTDPERTLLRRLSIFAGGWTLEAAETVCGDDVDVFELLTQLVNKSLVVAERRPGADTRYGLLETIRQYAREKLADTEDGETLRQRHLEFFVQLAEKWEPEMHGPHHPSALDALETEHDNLRAALEWALTTDPGAGLRLGGAIWQFLSDRGHWSEGREWLSKILALPGAQARTLFRAKALNGLAFLTYNELGPGAGLPIYTESLALWRELGNPRQAGYLHALRLLGAGFCDVGDKPRGRALIEESLALARANGDPIETAWSLFNLAMVADDEGRQDEAQALYTQSLALHRQARMPAGIAYVLNALGWYAIRREDWADAQARFEEALRRFRDLGDKSGLAKVFYAMATGEAMRGRYDRALLYFAESSDLGREINVHWQTAAGIYGLAWTHLHLGNLPLARQHFGQYLSLAREHAWHGPLLAGLVGLAALAEAQGDRVRATQLLSAAETQHTIQDGELDPPLKAELTRLRAALQQLEAAAYAQAWAAGARMTLDEAVEYALPAQP